MKRHSSIVSLSRDHHGALILARLLQKNAPAYKDLPGDVKGKAVYATEKYQTELLDHFLTEEKSLLDQVIGVDKRIDELATQIHAEHTVLRALFEMIPSSKNLEDDLDSLGRALENHIRKEERVLFPLIQETCDEALLNHIQNLLEAK
jgi:hemerythrin-like domain-containing protein